MLGFLSAISIQKSSRSFSWWSLFTPYNYCCIYSSNRCSCSNVQSVILRFLKQM